jgi:electron transfer flavoprotein alpha/beta subunit
MAAKKKEIAEVAPADLGLADDEVGAAGSRLEIVSVAFPESGAAAQILEGDPATAAKALASKLHQEARVI